MKEFTDESLRKRPDAVKNNDIVYLDADEFTYKYFLTGRFDEEARKKHI